MAENTKIEWATHTFNHVRGCTKVSDGCKFCYADTLSKRNPLTLGIWGPNGTRVVASEAMWKEPLKWDRQAKMAFDKYRCGGGPNKPPYERPRVFCASLADVFEDWRGPMRNARNEPLFVGLADSWDAPPMTPGNRLRHLDMQDVRRRLFDLIDATPNLDWLLLTKRPENVLRMFGEIADGVDHYKAESLSRAWHSRVWIGTSCENQATVDERIPHLLRVPAAVRFLSCEPLLGPVDLAAWLLLGIEWVIVGGESGPGARPCRVEWIRSIVEQCKAAGVPCFVKQDSGPRPSLQGRLDSDTWNVKEFPNDCYGSM
jgi:protein gp37